MARYRHLPESSRMDIIISSMVVEAVKTSEIEGEYVSRQDVVSSIRNNLGLNTDLEKVGDKRASGISELMLDVSNSFAEPLSIEKLFSWHSMLMKGDRSVKAGAWENSSRPDASGVRYIGKEKVHFEAPPSSQVPKEMKALSNGSTKLRQQEAARYVMPLYEPPSLIYISNPSIHLKMEMEGSVAPFPKK